MALAIGLAFGAAVASGFVVRATCVKHVVELRGGRRQDKRRGEAAIAAQAAARAAAAKAACGQGFSMEEARKHTDASQAKALARSPAEVLADLQRGNARFWMGAPAIPEASAFERRALIAKQSPSVAILGCSDSRVPTEIIFDQGLGDLFVIRVAGNALDVATLASLQYAVRHLKVKVLLVLGHELCGAVKAAQLPLQTLGAEPQHLREALKSIKVTLGQNRLASLEDSRALDREAVTTNVKKQVDLLTRSEDFMAQVRKQELMIVGGFYEISSGIVDFFHEVSGDGKDAGTSTRMAQAPALQAARLEAVPTSLPPGCDSHTAPSSTGAFDVECLAGDAGAAMGALGGESPGGAFLGQIDAADAWPSGAGLCSPGGSDATPRISARCKVVPDSSWISAQAGANPGASGRDSP